MSTITSLIPDPNVLLALEPEELAGSLLELLNILEDGNRRNNILHRGNFSLSCAGGYPPEYEDRIQRAMMEAWAWLEREVMIAYRPQSEWIFITRRGKKYRTAQDFKKYRAAALLPREILHPSLLAHVVPAFLRGDYSGAIFQAFKEVEVYTREIAKFGNSDIGVDLMRKAFNVETGPLTNKYLVKAERQAESDLFAGAIGLNKNPNSHRRIDYSDPTEAAELIVMASHLLRKIEARTIRNEKPTAETSSTTNQEKGD